MKLVPFEERNKHKCYFCGEKRSVKYLVKILPLSTDRKMKEVYCCNKCYLVHCDLIKE